MARCKNGWLSFLSSVAKMNPDFFQKIEAVLALLLWS